MKELSNKQKDKLFTLWQHYENEGHEKAEIVTIMIQVVKDIPQEDVLDFLLITTQEERTTWYKALGIRELNKTNKLHSDAIRTNEKYIEVNGVVQTTEEVTALLERNKFLLNSPISKKKNNWLRDIIIVILVITVATLFFL